MTSMTSHPPLSAPVTRDVYVVCIHELNNTTYWLCQVIEDSKTEDECNPFPRILSGNKLENLRNYEVVSRENSSNTFPWTKCNP